MKKNKAEILMHPVRMKVAEILFRYKEEGLTPLEMVKMLQDVPQATLYRHLQKLLDANIIRILKEEKVRAVSEKYYVINEEELMFKQAEWENYSIEEKLTYYSFYQILLKSRYENYLKWKKSADENSDAATFSIAELQLDDEAFNQFQNELQELILRYHHKQQHDSEHKENVPYQTVGVTIVPET